MNRLLGAISHVKSVVHLVDLHVKVLEGLHLLRVVHILLHLPLHIFHESLGLADVTTSGNRGAFLDGVVGKHVVVSLLLKLVPFCANVLLL